MCISGAPCAGSPSTGGAQSSIDHRHRSLAVLVADVAGDRADRRAGQLVAEPCGGVGHRRQLVPAVAVHVVQRRQLDGPLAEPDRVPHAPGRSPGSAGANGWNGSPWRTSAHGPGPSSRTHSTSSPDSKTWWWCTTVPSSSTASWCTVPVAYSGRGLTPSPAELLAHVRLGLVGHDAHQCCSPSRRRGAAAGVVARPGERARLDVRDAPSPRPSTLNRSKSSGVHHFATGRWCDVGRRYWPIVTIETPTAARSASVGQHLVRGLAHAEHQSGLHRQPGLVGRGPAPPATARTTPRAAPPAAAGRRSRCCG